MIGSLDQTSLLFLKPFHAKEMIIFLCLLTTGFTSCSQRIKEADVPGAVKLKLASMYPGIKNAKWDKEEGKYEAAFKNNGVETSVLIDGAGMHMQTEIDIQVSALPQGVNHYAEKNLSWKKITEASKITDAKGDINYEVEIGDVDYLFDAAGNFLMMQDKDDGEDEDDE